MCVVLVYIVGEALSTVANPLSSCYDGRVIQSAQKPKLTRINN